mmetsp:Transcript_19673/g.63231  ORF Transcript_19673/g.63231 Transcript_19673/m.63231 type:complete len:387 (-) Transcript_19673:143-1303(-)|eukprot:CAMPEP_0118914924 /NCGR_PEP_ID=MMETSP1166-20130328/15204_1 /TAXON_ID=1104430 /ORGANISM="Chrysoreinhardia sp, Strain CCMP3193" /LENGTH=386 /DNA_ID=CAMNT_0006854557 /DNA_START=80 /DNA_END=1240 /DNA_ORIENTATION=+
MVSRMVMQQNPFRSRESEPVGDETGDYVLSGIWQLQRRPTIDFKKRIWATNLRTSWSQQKTHASWSGSGWQTPFRQQLPDVEYVRIVMKSRGTFETPHGAKNHMFGMWSCDGSEVTLSRFVRGQVEEKYTGMVNASAEKIRGAMVYGAHDPEYSGKFTLTRQLGIFPIQRRLPKTTLPAKPSFKTTTFEKTKWMLNVQYFEQDYESVYMVRLHPNLTFTSEAFEDDGPRIAGKWNVYEENNINLATAIPGTGDKLWLWLRRFGTAKKGTSLLSQGIPIQYDQLFLGTIVPERNEPSEIANINGKVWIGWSVEPCAFASFSLVPWENQVSLVSQDDDYSPLDATTRALEDAFRQSEMALYESLNAVRQDDDDYSDNDDEASTSQDNT